MIIFKKLIDLRVKKLFIFLTNKKIAGISTILILGMAFLNGFSASFQIGSEKLQPQVVFASPQTTFISGYFPLVYEGIGVDHMNINLVNLNLTGLKAGDEIGVFDGIYCVGSAMIEEKHIQENSISIKSSANDTIESNPDGFIDGHKITLKAYRDRTVYQLYFQTVNNSKDVFERWESMFALVDFSKSTEQSPLEMQTGLKLYPNPFIVSVKIEVNLIQELHLTVEIFNMNGQLIRTLFEGKSEEQKILIWDGKDNRGQKVSYGIYLCRANQRITKIIYKSPSNSK